MMISSLNNQYAALLQQYGINKNNRTAATPNTTFKNTLSQAASGGAATDAVLTELKGRYGAQVYVDILPNRQTDSQNFQKQLNNLGSRTFGTNNIVIAPNILEKMANDPEAKQHYEKQIQSYFDSIPQGQAFMAAHGRRIVSSGVIVHEDGTVTSWSCSDYTPEEAARLKRKMQEEDEAKAKKRVEQKNLIEIAQANKVQTSEIAEKWINTKMLQTQLSVNNNTVSEYAMQSTYPGLHRFRQT